MNGKLNLDAPIKNMIVRILSGNCRSEHRFGRTEEHDTFFCDLMYIGCDFYDTLAVFASCDAIDKESFQCITENIPSFLSVDVHSDKDIRKMIPHWTSSRYRTASVEELCSQLKQHVTNRDDGVFIYNSNLNTKDKRAYNDMYILISRKDESFFFDINRKKSFKLTETRALKIQEDNQ
ncbi:MAG: hypothetical protein ACI4XE_02620 [Acutalibacteraceae bacterium]